VLSTSKENGGLLASIGLKKEASPKNGKENDVSRSRERTSKDKQDKDVNGLDKKLPHYGREKAEDLLSDEEMTEEEQIRAIEM